jgi:hypothetical protein
MESNLLLQLFKGMLRLSAALLQVARLLRGRSALSLQRSRSLPRVLEVSSSTRKARLHMVAREGQDAMSLQSLLPLISR